MYRQAKFDLRERREGQLNQAKKSSPPTSRLWLTSFCTTDVAPENEEQSSAEAFVQRDKPQWRGLKHFGEQFSGFGRSSFGICDWGVALSFLNTLRVFV